VRELVAWIRGASATGNVVLHCLGGLGRSGMVAACALVDAGLAPDDAIRLVREHRSPRAVETRTQEEFVHRFRMH